MNDERSAIIFLRLAALARCLMQVHKFFIAETKIVCTSPKDFRYRAQRVSHMCNDASTGVAFLRSKTELRQPRNRGIGLALHHRCNQPILKCNQQIATTFITFRESKQRHKRSPQVFPAIKSVDARFEQFLVTGTGGKAQREDITWKSAIHFQATFIKSVRIRMGFSSFINGRSWRNSNSVITAQAARRANQTMK